ncbi:DNA repair metallo-beta-lactamase-domain-containing protein [Lipomyces kononenkoae]
MPPPKSGRAAGGSGKDSASTNKRKASNKKGHTGPSLLNYFKRLKPAESTIVASTELTKQSATGLFFVSDDDDQEDMASETIEHERQVSVIQVRNEDSLAQGVPIPVQNERDSENLAVPPFVIENEHLSGGDDYRYDSCTKDSTARYASSPFEIVDDLAASASGDLFEVPANDHVLEESAIVLPRETVTCPVCSEELVDQTEDVIAGHVNSCLDHSAAEQLAEDAIDVHSDDEVNDSNDHIDDFCNDNDDSNFLDNNDSNDDKDIASVLLSEDIKIKQEPPSTQSSDDAAEPNISVPQTLYPPRNAISQLLMGRRESQKWTTATAKFQSRQSSTNGNGAAENSQNAQQMRRCPFYKIMNIEPGVAVDAFRFGAVPNISMYFLTHFHSDHYGGLSQTWVHGKIYCSEITGRLVIQQLRVNPEFVVMLPMDQRIEMGKFAVTLIDANHCPGSVLFLFETPRQRILHTGDFRASPSHAKHPSIHNKRVDSLYLDTTYLSPRYAFPHQSDVVEACADICYKLTHDDDFARRLISRKSEGNQGLMKKLLASITKQETVRRWLIIVGTYSIGKERMAIGIAKKIGAKIFAPPNKRRIYSCLRDPVLDGLLTSDPLEGQVHLVSLQEIRPDTLSAYLEHFKPHYGSIVGFRPTGWAYKSPVARGATAKAMPSVETIINTWHSPFSESDMVASRGSTESVMYFDIPYSEHSSFRDLTCFCISLHIGRVIPTVNVGTQTARDQMRIWFDKWGAERRRLGGVRKVADGQTTW